MAYLKLFSLLTIHLILISIWVGRVVNGSIPMQKCQGQDPSQRSKRPDCVCDSQSIVDYFSEAIHILPSMSDNAFNIITERARLFPCPEFIQLPSHLVIEMSDTVPDPYFYKRKLFRQRMKRLHRVHRDLHTNSHHRSKRQISLGYPTNSKWEEIIPHLPKRGSHHYVSVGSTGTLKCQGGEGQNAVLDKIDDAFREFHWVHANGMEITAPYVTIDRSSGNLVFHRARLADTGIYNCTVKSGEEGGLRDVGTFQSQLDVIAGPTYWLRFGMTYTVSRCQRKELQEIQRNIPNLVHKYVCHFCSVMNVSVTCLNLGRDGNSADRIVQLTLAISVLGFEDKLSSWSANFAYCNLECQKYIHGRVLNITSASLLKLFSLQIHVLPVKGETSVYTALPKSVDEDLADGCPPGFFLQYSLCFPCSPGTFSPSGPADCFPCDKASFQPNPGSSACFHCPAGRTTLKRGTVSQADCILESATLVVNNLAVIIWVGVVCLLIIIIILVIICCWPKSAVGRFLRCVPCCGDKGCCGCGGSDDGVEKEIPEESERLLIETTTASEQDSDTNPTTTDEENSGRRRVRRQTRTFYDETSDGEDFSAKDEESKDEESKDQESQNQESKEVTLSVVREDSTKKIRCSQSRCQPPKHLDLTQCPFTRPICPYPFRRGYCQNTLRSIKKQEEELREEEQRRLLENEQDASTEPGENDPSTSVAPPRKTPRYPRRGGGDHITETDHKNQSDGSESSNTKRFHLRNPHMKLGNILRKSRSLVTKLAEQRRKLRRVNRSKSGSKSSSRSKLATTAVASLSSLKDKLKQKMVTISEKKNTYHKLEPDEPCTTCTSNVFKKQSKDNIQKKDTTRNINTKSGRSSSRSAKLRQFREKSTERVKTAKKALQKKLDKRKSKKR